MIGSDRPGHRRIWHVRFRIAAARRRLPVDPEADRVGPGELEALVAEGVP
jgi:hypothetical protein